ncbi:GlpG protein (membrane protein of glp regulon) [Salmonella enterica subsp. arizonae]|nr:GlpG protein (membrane protein of glp regulon) [Salmonella enterica subsp. arizonae]
MGYVWLRGERDPQSGIYLQRGLIIFALLWIVAGWLDWFGMSMANGAHIAGLIVGLAMAFVDTLNARKTNLRRIRPVVGIFFQAG